MKKELIGWLLLIFCFAAVSSPCGSTSSPEPEKTKLPPSEKQLENLCDTKTRLDEEEKREISRKGLTATVFSGQKGANGGADVIKPRNRRNGAESCLLKPSSLSAILRNGVMILIVALLFP